MRRRSLETRRQVSKEEFPDPLLHRFIEGSDRNVLQIKLLVGPPAGFVEDAIEHRLGHRILIVTVRLPCLYVTMRCEEIVSFPVREGNGAVHLAKHS